MSVLGDVIRRGFLRAKGFFNSAEERLQGIDHKQAQEAPSEARRRIVISNSVQNVPADVAQAVCWNDSSAPCLLEFDVLILEAPSTDKTAVPQEEVALASARGATVVWLVGADAHSAVIKKYLAPEAVALRALAGGRNFRVIESGLLGYFRSVTHYWFVRPPPLRSRELALAVVDQSLLSVATMRPSSKSRGTTIFLPAPSQAEFVPAIHQVLHWLGPGRISATRSDEPGLRDVRIAWLALCVCVLAIVLLRFYQRDVNLTMHLTPTAAVPFMRVSDLDEESRPVELAAYLAKNWLEKDRLDGLPRLSPQDSAERYHDPDEIMHLYAWLGLDDKETAMATWLKTYPEPHYAQQHLAVVNEALVRDLRARRFQSARVRAVQLLDLYDDPDLWLHGELTELQSNRAHKTIDLVRNNYLYADPPVASALASYVLRRTDACYEDLKVDEPSLADDFAYCRLAANPPIDTQDNIKHWAEVGATFQGSDLRSLVRFNIVRTLYSDVQTGGKASFDALEESVMAYVKDFPTSYLADDALYYLIEQAGDLRRLPVQRNAWALFRSRPLTGSDKHFELTKAVFLHLQPKSESYISDDDTADFNLLHSMLFADPSLRLRDWLRQIPVVEAQRWKATFAERIEGDYPSEVNAANVGEIASWLVSTTYQ